MERIWYLDPSGFMTQDNFMSFFPSSDMSLAQQLNALLRFAIYFSIVIFVIKKDSGIFLAPLFMMAFTYMIFSIDTKNKVAEKKVLENMSVQRDVRTGELCSKSSRNNPFMNVTMDEYASNPARPRACKIDGKTKKVVKANFDHNLYRDVDDVFHKNASDRQFYTMPSTEIPNNSKAYAEWLYGSGKSCKEGDGTKCYNNLHGRYN
jgi:hypothetical protein